MALFCFHVGQTVHLLADAQAEHRQVVVGLGSVAVTVHFLSQGLFEEFRDGRQQVGSRSLVLRLGAGHKLCVSC